MSNMGFFLLVKLFFRYNLNCNNIIILILLKIIYLYNDEWGILSGLIDDYIYIFECYYVYVC